MQRIIARQVSFILFIAGAFFVLMAVVLFSSVRAQDNFGFLPDRDWEDWDRSDRVNFDVRYNRVQGLYLGTQMNREYYRNRYPQRAFLYGSVGYGFKSKNIEYQVGLEKGFFNKYRFAFGGEIHRLIDTQDRWILPNSENSLAAFFLKEDFHDFFLKEGLSGYVVQNLGESFSVTLGYYYDEYDSLEKKTNWSLFGGKKEFRENPAIDPGQIRSAIGRIVLDTRNSTTRTTRGWYIEIEAEHAGANFKGDFTFDRLLVDFRRFQPTGFGEGLDFRLRVGSSHGLLPWQRSYHLGGLSTLRGFPYKLFPAGRMNPGGNRMLLAQLEYRLGTRDFPADFWIFDNFNIILFADAGWAGYTGERDPFLKGFKQLTWSALKTDVGIAFANRSGNVRFQIARRLDTGKDPYVFSFRISRPF
jgi:hypothetical protein